jgi:hypothetical protein
MLLCHHNTGYLVARAHTGKCCRCIACSDSYHGLAKLAPGSTNMPSDASSQTTVMQLCMRQLGWTCIHWTCQRKARTAHKCTACAGRQCTELDRIFCTTGRQGTVHVHMCNTDNTSTHTRGTCELHAWKVPRTRNAWFRTVDKHSAVRTHAHSYTMCSRYDGA